MSTLAYHRTRPRPTHAYRVRSTNLARAVLAGLAAGFGTLFGVSFEDLVSRDQHA